MGRDGGSYCSVGLPGCVSESAVEVSAEYEYGMGKATHQTFMHLRVCISGGPLCDPHTSGRSASTGHGGRINRQKADERDGEIDIDGVVERDAECVGNVDEFGPADGQQSGLAGMLVAWSWKNKKTSVQELEYSYPNARFRLARHRSTTLCR